VIDVRDVTHTYQSDALALDSVSLSVPTGELWVVCGANGSGKTTLVRTFNGLLEPDEGRVFVDGEPVLENPVRARTRVGMTFQDPRDAFVAATVGADVAFGPENLGLDRGEIDRRVRSALAAVGMDGRGDERVDALSGGERARVAIAGALAMEPSHLVLDEPFAGLDWPAHGSVLARLRELVDSGTGVLVVTHDLRDLTEADRFVLLSEGRVVANGPPEAVRDRLAEHDVRPP
jgi:biotin transport system ATP-binding protein